MDSKEVGARIKELRLRRGLNKNALANLAGVSPSYIYQLEEGSKSPTVEYLSHICWGLNITLEEFFKAEKNLAIFDRVSNLTPEQKLLLNQFLNSL